MSTPRGSRPDGPGRRTNGRGSAAARAVQARRQRKAKQRRRGPSRWLWGPLGLGLVFIALTGGAAGVAYGVYRSYADDLVDPDAILDTQRVLGTSKVFDRQGPENGEILFEFADPYSGLRNPVRLHEISRTVIDATVSTEDASFWENEGVNLRGLARSAVENVGLGSGDLLGGSGGSSITQQLVKNVLIPAEERTGRDLDRVEGKIKETILAIEITERYSKEQILEWYLNTIFYGNLAYGIGAASERYFGKPAAELTLPEAALLAGIPQAPAIYDPFTNLVAAKERQALVLDLMTEHGYITAPEAEAAKSAPLRFASQQFDIQAPHFVLYVRDQVEALCQRGRIPLPGDVQDCADLLTTGGLRITTTLDLDLQRQAEEILRADVASFEEQTGAHNAALVTIDPRTGEILVMVGSRDFFREDIDGQVNLATALNSPGSSFKPITYVAGFVEDPKRWNPATVVWDVPLDFTELDGTVFSPENYDGIERGPVTIRSALANSMNIPAFRTAHTLGTETVLRMAHRLGITTMPDPRNYGPSLTLGGGDVTLLDMTYAYSAFASNGVMRGQRTVLDLPPDYRPLDPVAIREIRDSRGRLLYRQPAPEATRVLPAPQAYQITHILSDNPARAILYGLDSTLVLDRPAAAKTGTAGDPDRNDVRRDYWTVGYTPDLVTGVWVGNADNTPMPGGSSSRTAGLIWHDFMIAAHAGTPASEFTQPPGLTAADVIAPALRVLQTPEERKASALQDPCATVLRELFVAEDGVPEKENGFCAEQRVDTRTLRLATDATPPEFIAEGLYLTPPAAEDPEGEREDPEPDPDIVQWLRENKVRFILDEDSSEALVVGVITVPTEGAEIAPGVVLIQGRASSEDVREWSLAYAAGDNPPDEEFTVLAAGEGPAAAAVLTRWDVRPLAPGPYVLRLTVEHDFFGEMVHIVRITIIDPKAPPGATRAPEEADG